MRNCSVCNHEAIYRRHYSGESLCRRCFIESIEKRARRTISRFKMFRPDDHIALALSGGKDSVSLLQVLSTIEEDFPGSTLSAILIDEGIEGYRGEAIAIAEENCERLNVPLHVYSFKTIYGRSLDEVAEASKDRGSLSVCSYCGVLRRKALNVAAKAVKASKLALAHNLDDEVQSMVLSLLRGDLANLVGVKPVLEKVEGFVQRVKPFCEILEREIAFFAYVKDVRFQSIPCPYLESSMRSDVRRFVNVLEGKHAGITYGIAGSLRKIQGRLKGVDVRGELRQCQTCGEPSSGKVCRACQVLEELGLD
ncbi:MAG: TIGR00269 family protein [Candidatus Bathyarchaeota archaeon]|nr:TIGR00269 family protein [Candidatus Bathyarchaeota archaeon]